jgi:tRNA threonylcarbamoyladenosine biosynthesis protein TsaE
VPVPAILGPVVVTTSSAEETRSLGGALAAVAAAGDRIALIGPLGAGKTQLAKGFATGLGISEVVNSPSFTLMAEYVGRLPLFHLDLYRLSGSGEVLAGGLLDERQVSGVTVTEWAERLDAALDPDRLEVHILIRDDDSRAIELRASDPRQGRYLDAAARWAAGHGGHR